LSALRSALAISFALSSQWAIHQLRSQPSAYAQTLPLCACHGTHDTNI
jgi:hypothetical protein